MGYYTFFPADQLPQQADFQQSFHLSLKYLFVGQRKHFDQVGKQELKNILKSIEIPEGDIL